MRKKKSKPNIARKVEMRKKKSKPNIAHMGSKNKSRKTNERTNPLPFVRKCLSPKKPL